MKNLLPEQERLIEKYFRIFIKSVDFKKEMEDREQHRKLSINILERTKLKNMTEIEFGELISNLWASSMWGNKDYLVKKIIDDNGIDKITIHFNDLLYGTDSFEKRFEKFISP